MTKRVLIVMAMRAEAATIVASLSLGSVESPDGMPFDWYRGDAASLDVMVAVNGVDSRFGVDSIATIPAALNTYAAASEFGPDLVISAGTAGGWARHGTEVGDVFLSGPAFVHHDRRIQLGRFASYGVGSHPGIDTKPLAARLGFKVGTVTTSNSLDQTVTDDEAMSASGARVKEMEAAAVAYVCEQMGLAVMAVKVITDLVDHPAPTADQFSANLETATMVLGDSMAAVLLDLESNL